jgi:hypothetical protein
MAGRLNIPDETLLALKLSADAAEHELVLVAAVKLYEMGRLSGGRRCPACWPAQAGLHGQARRLRRPCVQVV